jgi:type II secretory pathway pseudopilin PulG
MKVSFESNGSRAARRLSGWTLLEMSVSVAIGSVIIAALMQTSMFTSRSFVAMGNYADLDRYSRNALDNMTRDIRQAKVFSPQYYATNMMMFTNLNNGYFGYVWDPNAKTVSRLTGDYNAANGTFVNIQTNVLLTGCTFFSFRIWLRNPTNDFTFPYSADSDVIDAKLVDVSWRCSRRVLDQYDTESVQTARIVLRN